MRRPTEIELQHLAAIYDPLKAHEYYLKNRELKGRKRGRIEEDEPGWDWRTMGNKSRTPVGSSVDPRTGKSMDQIRKEARTKARKRVTEQINRLEGKVKKIEARIRELMQEEASEDRKGKAKKERAAKEADKPKSAAEKAEAARESEKYRDKHKQELSNKAKDADKSGDGKSSDKKTEAKIANLKASATKLKGRIAVAKQKLAAL